MLKRPTISSRVEITLFIRRLYDKILSTDEKRRLEQIADEYRKTDAKGRNTADLFADRGRLVDFINYKDLSDQDLLFVCKILAKTITTGTGTFHVRRDHFGFIRYMAQNPRQNLTDIDREHLYMQFVNSVLLLETAPFIPPEEHPELPSQIHNIIHPIAELQSTFASFVAFPLLEAISRRMSSLLTANGRTTERLDRTIRGTKIHYSQDRRVSNLQHTLLLMELDLKPDLRRILEELDSEMNLYSRIWDMRCTQLHGAHLRSSESLLIVFLLYLIYLSESKLPQNPKPAS